MTERLSNSTSRGVCQHCGKRRVCNTWDTWLCIENRKHRVVALCRKCDDVLNKYVLAYVTVVQ